MRIPLAKAALWLFAVAIAMGVMPANAENPFAEVKVVLQISDGDPDKQTLILNVANNMLQHYGPDKVDIEIVAFGPGLRLMFADNANADRVQSLAGSGVRFGACTNTMRKMTGLRDGDAPKLHDNASLVGGGIVRIVDLVKQGYILVKP